jgi:hypothetical protein
MIAAPSLRKYNIWLLGFCWIGSLWPPVSLSYTPQVRRCCHLTSTPFLENLFDHSRQKTKHYARKHHYHPSSSSIIPSNSSNHLQRYVPASLASFWWLRGCYYSPKATTKTTTTMTTTKKTTMITASKENRFWIDSKNQQQQQIILGLGLFVSPCRWIRFLISSILLAELVDYLGILDHPKVTRERIRKSLQYHLPLLPSQVKRWWIRARKKYGLLHPTSWSSPSNGFHTLSVWKTKHQFAVGTAVGWIGSPLFSALLETGTKLTLILYVIAEINALSSLRRTNHLSIVPNNRHASTFSYHNVVYYYNQKKSKINSKATSQALSTLQRLLDSLRITVRHTISHPHHLWNAIGENWNDRQLLRRPLDIPPKAVTMGFLLGILLGKIVMH